MIGLVPLIEKSRNRKVNSRRDDSAEKMEIEITTRFAE